jgi:hypothetical protein
LSRFDGYRFTNYGVKDRLTQQHVTHLLESRRSGAYWVATQGGGVGRFDPAIRAAEARRARKDKSSDLYTIVEGEE